jgi:hypothetical protein
VYLQTAKTVRRKYYLEEDKITTVLGRVAVVARPKKEKRIKSPSRLPKLLTKAPKSTRHPTAEAPNKTRYGTRHNQRKEQARIKFRILRL